MDNAKSLKDLSFRIRSVVLIFFFFSGITGLIYEILWTRMITEIIGAAPFAVSIILTVFMGGLGIGSYIASRTIDRIREPFKLVKIYGILELIIGIYASAIPILLIAFKPIQAFLYNQLFAYFLPYNLLSFFTCALLLGLPVVCMGATLPILCRFYVTSLSRLSTHVGRLYGLNTIGAAVGAVLCGFWLINLLGVWGTMAAAVFINITIGVSCLWMYFRGKSTLKKKSRSFAESKECVVKEASQESKSTGSSKALYGALIILAVSGFCSMAYEVIWTKLLGLVVGPTTYSFTIVLVTFITGLALGSLAFGKLADRTKNLLWLLFYTQIGAALLVLGVSQLLGNSQLFFTKIIFNFREQFALLNLVKAVILFSFMILPTLCLGAAFPLVGKIYTRSLTKVGRSIGVAYALNTAGAVLGSFCAGFLFIPLLGKERGISFIIGLQLLTSLAIAVIFLGLKKKNLLKLSPLALSALIGLFFCFYFPSWNHNLFASGKYYRFNYLESVIKSTGWMESLFRGTEILSQYDKGEVIYSQEGMGGFITVLKTHDPLGNVQYSMANSGKMDASSREDMKTQTLLAHFPMLFHPSPKTVMVLGLASGITAGEVLYYPIEQLDILEINQQVVAASDFFLPWNNYVLSHPKTNLIVQDARTHLQLSGQKYDVIISEPSNPWMAGLAALFTRDFFIQVKKRLNRDGIFVQWIHSYNMDWATFSLVGRTFTQIFPNSILISNSPPSFGQDYLLVGFKGERGLNLDIAQQNLPYVQKSKNVHLTDPKLLYRLIVSENAGKLFGQGMVSTDRRPRLEFAAPKLMYHSDREILKELGARNYYSPETESVLQKILTDVDMQVDFAHYALSLYMPFRDMVDLFKATPVQKERFFRHMESYCAENSIDYAIIESEELRQRCRSIQIESIESKIEGMPDKADSYFYLANLYFGSNKLDKAIFNYSRSLQFRADNFYAFNNLGYALMLQGKITDAIRHFDEAIRLKTDFAEAHRNLGYALAYQGNLKKAADEYRKAIKLTPRNPILHKELGMILSRQGKFEEAIQHFEEALRIKPDYAEARRNLDIAKKRKKS